jgi:transposase InsO family protein
MSQRHEFVLLASQTGVNFRQLCRRFRISPKTGYKWKQRFVAGGACALLDRSRRPRTSPQSSGAAVVESVIALRKQQPTWGGRKLRRRLQDLHQRKVPAASTCTAILRRAELLAPAGGSAHTAWQRFERAQPNELWQMDFKGHFPTQAGPRCHPLTVLDDHSRFNVVLAPCGNETGETVQAALTAAFGCYGLPEALLCDNSPPWGCTEPVCPYTTLSVWLLRLGVRVRHGRPYHPQTQGKDERFHRTLHNDLIARHSWSDLAHCAREFPGFRDTYNCARPHDSLDGATPISRYRPSPRSLPAVLPSVEYPATDTILRVRTEGSIFFAGHYWYVGRAFVGLSVGLRPSAQTDRQWEVFFGSNRLGQLDLALASLASTKRHSIYFTPPSASEFTLL